MTSATARATGAAAPSRSSSSDTFDIYQTAAGYVAVHSDLQRRILLELQAGDRSFAELVDATDRSKATISASLAELVEKGFVKEGIPPGDRRRRVYTALAKRIGSSDIPLPDLRKAVQKYVRATAGPGYGLRTILRALSEDAPASAATLVWTQASRFGGLAAEAARSDNRPPWIKLGEHLEGEGVGRMVSVDLRAGSMEVELEPSLDASAVAAALAGFAHGFIQPGKSAKVLGNAEAKRIVRLKTA
jgi:DNA-binding HxlR family transcriptional regulator